jgi:hypothetical protein
MTFSRLFSSLLPAAALAIVFAGVSLAPRTAHADVSAKVADIAAKGSIPAAVPVEAGLGFGMVAALFAVGMQRRTRR